PGVFRCMDETRLLKVVGEAKNESDYVIVFIHWGTENELGPDWLQARQAPELAEAGADLVIGMHSHCLQPVTYEGDVPVFYSLGNFLFNSKTLDTCLVEATLERVGSEEDGTQSDGEGAVSAAGGGARLKELRFIPCIQSGCTVRMADETERARILDFMRSVSPGVMFDEEGVISR
nr:CapA family protein [Lachnospiraceae bacterium]